MHLPSPSRAGAPGAQCRGDQTSSLPIRGLSWACQRRAVRFGRIEVIPKNATPQEPEAQPVQIAEGGRYHQRQLIEEEHRNRGGDRKSTRLNSSHRTISYAVFCLKKK